MNELLDTEVSSLVDAALQANVIAIRGEIDRLLAAEATRLNEWDNRKLWASDDSRSAAHRLARESGCSINTGKHLMHRARRLRTMPATAHAFASGDLSADRVDLLVRLNQPNVAHLFERDEDALVREVGSLFFSDAALLCRYWSNFADEAGSSRRGTKQVEQRSASACRTFEGSVDLRALFDPVNGETFLSELERLEHELFKEDWAEASEHEKDVRLDHLKRTNRQRRADALVEMAKRSAAMPAGAQKPRPLLTVVLGAQAFAKTCETSTGTVLTPDAVIPLLKDADIERIVFDGPSRVIDVSHKRAFTGALRRAIEVRDRRCQHSSGCEVMVGRTEVDHHDPWGKGGATVQENGRLLCGWHNRAKGADPPSVA